MIMKWRTRKDLVADAWGYNWATLFLEDINKGPGPPGWGTLESETVKHGHESRGTPTQEQLLWRGPAAIVNDRPVLSSDRAPHVNNPVTV
jgi:hypothetical protein